MAIAYIGGDSDRADFTSISLDVPAGVNDGDVLIAYVTVFVETPTAPAGWTQIAATDANNLETKTWYRVASSEPASYTFTESSGVRNIAGIMLAYSGVDTGSVVDVHGESNGSGTELTAPSVAATGAGQLLCLYSVYANTVLDNATDPNDTTLRVSQDLRPDGRAFDKAVAAGATGARTIDSTVSGSWSGTSVVLTAAAAGNPLGLFAAQMRAMYAYGGVSVG